MADTRRQEETAARPRRAGRTDRASDSVHARTRWAGDEDVSSERLRRQSGDVATKEGGVLSEAWL